MRRMLWPKFWLVALVVLLGVAGCNTLDIEVDESAVPVELEGPCGPILNGFRLGFQEHFLEWTPDGAQITFNYAREGQPDIYRHLRAAAWAVDSQGTWMRMLVDAGLGWPILYGLHADVSPDGARIVYGSCEFPTESISVKPYEEDRLRHRYEIAVIDLDGTEQQRLTENEHTDHYPVWSPDGSHIAFIASARDPGGDSLMETLHYGGGWHRRTPGRFHVD